ncbi:glycosyltransferase family 4 protein [Candidatus Oscillochloris fontis]|uniref:glycosyltransferase family 4 protein n=1 Tax=Candidatus Oscillochloris fontis TaxID=2496868 RepID=UPI00101BE15E|nr:glycosyltransferase family 4 protein [Candidatus Oscillochloris fontis]
MHIVMIAPFGIRPKGTLLARMLPLAQALQRRSHQVFIAAPPVQNPEDAGNCVDYEGVMVAHTHNPRWPGPLAILEQSRSLLHLALAKRPDLIHLFKPKGYGGLAALEAKRRHPDIPLVVDTDDWEGWGGWNDLLPYPRSAKLLFAWQERNLPRRADAVTVVSRTLESLVWSFGVPPERVFYLPNGMGEVKREQLERRRQPPTILLYTRFWEFDLHDVIAALVGIHHTRPDVRLVVVGRGERGEEQEMLDLAAQAGIGAMIDYRGWLQPSEIPYILAGADVALVPLQDTLINRARGLAKLLELMSAGLPIVASEVGQTNEYLEHERSGLLCAPGNPEAMASAILRLLGDAELRTRLGAGARQRATHFAWDNLALTAEAAYAQAMR